MPLIKKRRKFLSLYKKPYKVKRPTLRRIEVTTKSPVKRCPSVLATPKVCFQAYKRSLTFTPHRTPKRKRHFEKCFSLPLERLAKKQEPNVTVESKKQLKFDDLFSDNSDTEAFKSEILESNDTSDIYEHVKHRETVETEYCSDENSDNDLQNTCFNALENIEDSDSKDELKQTIRRLIRVVRDGKYSTSAISFKLFEDTLKWYDSDNTSAMRYSQETKDFFWTGQKLLGGQFLRFMRGVTHEGKVKEKHSIIGSYNPIESEINLPVPSDRVLREYKPEGISVEERVDPGIIQENIKTYSESMRNTSFTVMFDGKKIIPQSADIYLLDQEDEPKMSNVRKEHENDLKKLSDYNIILESLRLSGIEDISMIGSSSQKDEYIASCKNTINVLSNGTRDLRTAYAKKAMYLQACEKKLSETNDKKYNFVCNKIRTLMYQINICVKGLLEVIDVVAGSCAVLNREEHLFKSGHCNLTTQQNYKELRENLSCQFQNIPSEYMKQRSPDWFELRRSVKVTGSVAQTAVGLDTLIAQKKYFDSVFLDNPESKAVSDNAKAAMEHGAKNEVNAIATLVSKIMPVYYPNSKFHEEGAYILKNEKGESRIIISPDGSLRGNDRIESVEIKCPFSKFVGSTPIYYEFKPRHAVQCMLEADVMKADEHLYISWSNESTSVFKMTPRKQFVNDVVEEVEKTYYTDTPVRPKKLSENARLLKTEAQNIAAQAEFVGEFLSVKANSSPRADNAFTDESNVYYQQEDEICPVSVCVKQISGLIENTYKGMKHLKEGFQFMKPIASEVMVYLMSDVDRNWHREIGHGLPIAFLFKGYSLSMSTSRRILDRILNACKEHGAHVPCTTFDGQFSRLKDYDESENPLSLFGLQRKLWTEMKKMNKKQLLEKLQNLFARPTYQLVTDIDIDENGMIRTKHKHYEVFNEVASCLPAQTAIKILKRKVNATERKNQQKIIDDDTQLKDSAGLEDSVLEVLENVEVVEENNSNTSEEDKGINQNMNTFAVRRKTKEDAFDESPVVSDERRPTLRLQTHDYEHIQKLLSVTKRKKWTTCDIGQIMNAFESPEAMNQSFTGYELNDIIKYLSLKLMNIGVYIKHNMRKAEKINLLCSSMGKDSKLQIPETKKKVIHVKSLRNMCLKELNKKDYPKEALAASYSRCIWPLRMDSWLKSSAVDQQITITNMEQENGEDTFIYTPIYSPEYSTQREQLEVRVMDGTHIRTNIKSKLIRNGLDKIKLYPWKMVAESGSTILTTSMLEVRDDGRIMHQQSDPFVRTMFCADVERQMLENGCADSAKFCRLFRQWHEAEDMPGISAFERCQRSASLRGWLMEGYDFSNFPPPTQYIKGIPRVTFEGLVCSIEAHFLLYALVKGGTYNWRSISTLVAENFMGELAERSTNNNGVPSGKSLPVDMCKISQLHAMRLNPNRSFKMKTAKSYEVPDAKMRPEDNTTQQSDPCYRRISHIYIRDHQFDRRDQHTAKHGKISNISDAPRGVQSVRTHYKVDESKILPSLRMGISENEIKNLLT